VSESLPELPGQSGLVPPRPAGRNRAVSLIGAVAGATLLVAGVAACGGGSSPAKSSAGSSGSSSSGGSSVPTPATTPGPLTEPAQIATLQKAADQSVATDLLHSMQATAKGAQISAVTYVDSSNKTHTVLIYGGDNLPGLAGAPAKKIKVMLKSGIRVGVGSKLGRELPVPAGSMGGMARCAPLISPGSGVQSVTCGWTHGKSVLVMAFGGFDAKSAKSLVPQIIAAMEKG
jgi:hypothetical protein